MDFFLHVLVISAIFAILGLSLNLVVGQTGLLFVAHAAFYGLGAYVAAILLTKYHVSLWIAFLAAIAVTGIVAFLIGLVLSSLRGDYYALGSLGFNVIVYGAMLNLDSITRGPLGIPGVPAPVLFGTVLRDPASFLPFALIFVILTLLICVFLVRAPFGRVLKAIREDEDVLQIFGYRVLTYKLTIFVLSAMLAAIAGVLYATYVRFVDPSAFVFLESVNFLAMIILGGLGTIRGSLFGAVVFVFLFAGVRFLGFSPDLAGQMRAATIGLVLILLMLFRPKGLFGEYKL